ANLLEIYRALTGCDVAQLRSDLEGVGYGRLKETVAEVTISALLPIQERCRDLLADPRGLDQILARGAERARSTAAATMGEVREKLGLLPAAG
ncbi:MAG: tryptophan--tRNA ligase, partial [Candidatus Dormiibacterota bacterium]